MGNRSACRQRLELTPSAHPAPPSANKTNEKCPETLRFPGIFFQLWWPGTESNHRHADFQSAALPTELPGHEERKYIKGDYVAQVLFGTFLL
jgi:hypothetical protein